MAGRDDRPKREGSLQRFVRETVGELRRVSWPTGPEARRLTWIVVMALFLGLVDSGAHELLKLAIGA